MCFTEEIELRPADVSQLVGNQEIICLDSSSGDSEDETQRKVLGIKDGKDMRYNVIYSANVITVNSDHQYFFSLHPFPITEVIELSSGEEESLQIVDSGDSTNEVDDAEIGGENSGSHVNDTVNLPDAFGRVLVNINHPPNEKDLFLAPQLAQVVKPHQVRALSEIRF